MVARKTKKKQPTPAPIVEKPRPVSGLTRFLSIPAAPWLKWVEWAVFALGAVLVIYFQVRLFNHAGSFWRDEVGTIQFSRQPTFAQFWHALGIESYPPLFDFLLRYWIAFGTGSSEAGIRLFGTLIGIGSLISIVVARRWLGGGVPIVSLALICLNATILYYGSSIRTYGLATALLLLCIGAFWRLVSRPDRWSTAAALVTAVLTAYSSYQNCCVLFGIGIGAACACAVCRQWRRAALVLGICAVAAASVATCIPNILRFREVSVMCTFDLSFYGVMHNCADAFAGTPLFLTTPATTTAPAGEEVNVGAWGVLLAWIALVLAAGVIFAWRVLIDLGSPARRKEPSLPLYCLVTGVVGLSMGFVFIKAAGMIPLAWQFIPFIGLAGMLIDAALQTAQSKLWALIARGAVLLVVVAFAWSGLDTMSQTRRTNLDLVCDMLAEKADPQDLIIVTPVYLCYGFDYHYHGKAKWETIPPIGDDKMTILECFLPYKRQMMTPRAIEPSIMHARATLSSGHRLWFVGSIMIPPPNFKIPPQILPPHPQFGWNYSAYNDIFSLQLGADLNHYATNAPPPILVPVEGKVINWENIPVRMVEGWSPR